jgi:hypothetical protein
MNKSSQLAQQKSQILAQLAALGPMRKGSLNDQYVLATLKDGSQTRRGPYTVFTCKVNSKTISQRLTSASEVALYREQIATFHRFQELTAQLLRIGQALADLEAAGDEGCKKNSRN